MSCPLCHQNLCGCGVVEVGLGYQNVYAVKAKRLEAENEQLREALEEIMRVGTTPDGCTVEATLAYKALARGDELMGKDAKPKKCEHKEISKEFGICTQCGMPLGCCGEDD